MIEIGNVKIYEFTYKNYVERKKETRCYNRFLYVNEGVLDTLPKLQ